MARAKRTSDADLERLGIDGQRLALRRGSRNMTQQELAVAAGTTVGNVSKIEGGKKGCHMALGRQLAVALGCSLDFLAGLSDTP